MNDWRSVIGEFMLVSTGIQKSESVLVIKFRMAVLYLGCLGMFFVPCTPALLTLALISFFLRTFAAEAGYHRYFSHRSFKTSRAFQLILAVLGAASGQRGPLWWAVHHREHHRYSDTDKDPHTPIGHSRFYAYVGWIFHNNNCDTNLDEIKDFAKYPELVWINKYHYLFPYFLLGIVFALGQWTSLLGDVGGLAAIVWGFFVATVVSLSGMLLVNAFAHGRRKDFWSIFSYRSYNTQDNSRNNWLLCLVSLGTCWHNNHHRYMNAARAGFRWWELDISYWVLRLLALFGIVWDLHEVPKRVLDEYSVRSPKSPSVA